MRRQNHIGNAHGLIHLQEIRFEFVQLFFQHDDGFFAISRENKSESMGF